MKHNCMHIAPRVRACQAGHPTIGCRKLCYLSVFLLSAGAIHAAEPAESASRKWEQAIRQFELADRQDAPPEGAVLFVGSSSIRLWPTRQAFAGLSVINRGFGGSQIADVNYYLQRIVIPYAPRAVVLYAGDNDVAAGKTAVQVANDFRTFAQRVHRHLRQTTIVFVSIKPSIARWKLWPEMNDANRRIREYVQQDERLRFADIATPMLDVNDRPRPELFLDDGLHLNDRGYAVWNRVVGACLDELGLKTTNDTSIR